MSKHPDRGALPHRSVSPRPGELFEDLRAIPDSLLIPLLYADTKTYGDLPTLACPSCGFCNVHLVGIGIVRREDYAVVEKIAISEWRRKSSTRWRHTPVNEDVRDDSLMLDLECELGHAAVVELGQHNGLLATRVTRYDNDPNEPMWKSW